VILDGRIPTDGRAGAGTIDGRWVWWAILDGRMPTDGRAGAGTIDGRWVWWAILDGRVGELEALPGRSYQAASRRTRRAPGFVEKTR
jgi:integral membrane sensor domain MASE1